MRLTTFEQESIIQHCNDIFPNSKIYLFGSRVDDLKKGKFDNLLIYKKAIRKSLKEYVKTTPPHVKAARKLDKITSNIISYIMTVEGPEPIEKIEHEIDYNHYIEKQVKPIADSVLVFFDTCFDDIIRGSSQTSLFKFGQKIN